MSCKCTTDGNETSLIIGSENGYDIVVNLLIQAHADVNQCRTNDGVSLLIAGSQYGHNKVVDLLIRAQADVNQCTTNSDMLPLISGSYNGRIIITEMLLYIVHGCILIGHLSICRYWFNQPLILY